MNSLDGMSAYRSAGSTEQPAASSGKTKDAAQQFEALLIASMLQSWRQQSSWLGSGEDSGGDSAIGYAEEHLAQALAAQGGFGIAATVISGLDANQNRPYATATAGSNGTAGANTTGDSSSGAR